MRTSCPFRKQTTKWQKVEVQDSQTPLRFYLLRWWWSPQRRCLGILPALPERSLSCIFYKSLQCAHLWFHRTWRSRLWPHWRFLPENREDVGHLWWMAHHPNSGHFGLQYWSIWVVERHFWPQLAAVSRTPWRSSLGQGLTQGSQDVWFWDAVGPEEPLQRNETAATTSQWQHCVKQTALATRQSASYSPALHWLLLDYQYCTLYINISHN